MQYLNLYRFTIHGTEMKHACLSASPPPAFPTRLRSLELYVTGPAILRLLAGIINASQATLQHIRVDLRDGIDNEVHQLDRKDVAAAFEPVASSLERFEFRGDGRHVELNYAHLAAVLSSLKQLAQLMMPLGAIEDHALVSSLTRIKGLRTVALCEPGVEDEPDPGDLLNLLRTVKLDKLRVDRMWWNAEEEHEEGDGDTALGDCREKMKEDRVELELF